MDVGCAGVVSGSLGEGAYCHEQRRNRPGLVEFTAGHQFGDMGQGHSQAFQRFGFVALQLAGTQLFGQYDPVAMAQVPRSQCQLAQFGEAFGAHADFFAQFALRCLQVVFIGLRAALGQAEYGFFHADRVFAHQQHMLWIGIATSITER